MTNLVLLTLSCTVLVPISTASLNSSRVLDEVRSILENIEKTPDKIFEIELALAEMEVKDEDLLGSTADLAKKVKGQLIDFPPTMYKDLFDLELQLSRLFADDESKEDEEESCGVWHLGMNLNPSNGHIMGYDGGWADDDDIGSESTALLQDYLNQTGPIFGYTAPGAYTCFSCNQQD